VIGYGGNASRALAAHPHGYLSVATPGALTATLIGLAAVLMRATGARGRSTNARSADAMRLGFVSLWLGCAILLASIFAIQETLEGAGAVAGGGWIGLALALPVSALVALALRGSQAAEELRTAAATLRVFVPAVSRHGILPLRAPLRAAFAPIGARGPPPVPVV
jgi:hypothetical protein